MGQSLQILMGLDACCHIAPAILEYETEYRCKERKDEEFYVELLCKIDFSLFYVKNLTLNISLNNISPSLQSRTSKLFCISHSSFHFFTFILWLVYIFWGWLIVLYSPSPGLNFIKVGIDCILSLASNSSYFVEWMARKEDNWFGLAGMWYSWGRIMRGWKVRL